MAVEDTTTSVANKLATTKIRNTTYMYCQYLGVHVSLPGSATVSDAALGLLVRRKDQV